MGSNPESLAPRLTARTEGSDDPCKQKPELSGDCSGFLMDSALSSQRRCLVVALLFVVFFAVFVFFALGFFLLFDIATETGSIF